VIRVADVVRYLEELAPLQSAAEWDNVGLQVGSAGATVHRVLVTLDVTPEVVAEAEDAGAELILSHHPLILDPLRALTTDDPVGALVTRLVRSGIALYVAHTNLDAAPVIGTALALSERLDFRPTRPLICGEAEGGLGAVAELPEAMPLEQFAEVVRERLAAPRVTVVGSGEAVVRRVAFMPGSGGDAVGPAVAAGVQVLVCGDLRHHDGLAARGWGLAVLDAGHYATELPVVGRVAAHLRERIGQGVDVIESGVCTDPFRSQDRAADGGTR